MIKYRITKYDPAKREEDGYYQLDDWISVSDIDKHIVTKEEYLFVENNYVAIIINIMEHLKIEGLKVNGLEKGFNLQRNIFILSKYNIFLDKNQQYIFKTIKNNNYYHIKEIKSVVKLILRECMWCRLVSPSVKFTFGYDYYMYFHSVTDFNFSLIQIPNGIYIEQYDEESQKYIYLK